MASIMLYPKLVESKTSANEIVMLEWNPRIDLLATVFAPNKSEGNVLSQLTCSHLLSLQKVWHKKIQGPIAATTWRPDGRVLVIAHLWPRVTNENIINLHDVENGKKITTIISDFETSLVNWFRYSPPVDDYKARENLYLGSSKNLVDIGQKCESSESSDTTFSHQLACDQSNLDILIVAGRNKVSFYALGLFYVGSMTIGPCLVGSPYPKKIARVTQCHMSSCMEYLTIIIDTSIRGNRSGPAVEGVNPPVEEYRTSLRIYRFDIFKESSYDILRVAKMYAKIKDELGYLDDTINAITTSWADVLAGLDNKLSSYCSRKNRNPDDSDINYTFLSADELLQLLVIGYPSDNLEKFLADMSDKGLNKLNNAIEQTCLRVQNLIVKNAQKCCYHLHGDLNQLRGMSLWYERYAKIGLDDKFIVEAMMSVGSLMLKLTELQQVIDHSLKSTKSFFRWLISIASRMMGEQNNSATPSDINKTTQQDIQLITDFILENFDYNSNDLDMTGPDDVPSWADLNSSDVYSNRPTCSNFTLEQVGQYLKNESLSRLKYSFCKPNSNFWIEFFKKRPELTAWKSKADDEDKSTTLLFYPHNEKTSLIQEYKTTCFTIQEVFKCVPVAFESTFSSPIEFIQFKNFLRNTPANRIRVEANLRLSQHYTLFQTKQTVTQKQYLIVLSLVDASFKLLSIEFRATKSRKSAGSSRASNLAKETSILNVCDSSFYEIKETKEFLLTFLLLDTVMNDTLIVQLELSKLLAGYDCDTRYSKDIGKIFRDDDSIDKNSNNVVLDMDIYTEPPEDRVFPHSMMVKKIKKTVGKDMFSSSGRGVIAFTSSTNKRLHLYELESVSAGGIEITDDEIEICEKIDESLID